MQLINKLHPVAVILFLYAATWASDALPSDLTIAQKSSLDSALNAFLPNDACCATKSLAACRTIKKNCPTADRLYAFASWLASRNAPRDTILAYLEMRRDCLTNSQRFPLDLKGYPAAGPENAPVTMVVYFSGGCPLCKFVLAFLDSVEVAGGSRAGLRVVAKPFTTGLADSLLMAADKMGRFWDLELALHQRSERPTPKLLDRLIDSLKIDRNKLALLRKDTVLMGLLHASRAEGVRNGVTLVPTVFINGMKYKGYKDPKWLYDAAEYVKESLEEKR
jgi:glutaredoxin